MMASDAGELSSKGLTNLQRGRTCKRFDSARSTMAANVRTWAAWGAVEMGPRRLGVNPSGQFLAAKAPAGIESGQVG